MLGNSTKTVWYTATPVVLLLSASPVRDVARKSLSGQGINRIDAIAAPQTSGCEAESEGAAQHPRLTWRYFAREYVLPLTTKAIPFTIPSPQPDPSPKPVGFPEYLTPQEVAGILRASVDTVVRQFEDAEGVIDLGSAEKLHRRRKRMLRIPRAAVERFIREKQVSSRKERPSLKRYD